MIRFICGLMLGSLLTAGLGFAVSNDGDYWWYKGQQQRKQDAIDTPDRDRDRDRYDIRKQPC